MASRPFDEEELSISLSSMQLKKGNEPSPAPEVHVSHHGPPGTAGMAPDTIPQSSKEKARAGQRIDAYNVIRTLGEGSFGKVRLAVHRSTGQQVALKIIARRRLISRDMAGRVEREIEYLQLLRHPHIIKLYTVIKTETEIIMVLEYAGGELFDYIVAHGKMKEAEARRFFQQMLCAVEYCHRHKIVHRDLKPENLLLDENLNVKIADFGLSNIMTDGNFLKTSCGSPNYAAPEVISGKLYAGPEVDVWSCGVILYVLLVGRLPFDDESIPQLFAKIARGTYVVPTWMSPGAAGLIKKMLVVNPVQRATIDEIRQDPWFMTDLPSYLQPPVEEFLNTGVDPNKAIRVSDIAPGASSKVQEKLHSEVTEKISKTMGYGKRDVEEALEADEPSAIKDAYMIVRENKMMQVNPNLGPENPYFATSPPVGEEIIHPPIAGMDSTIPTGEAGASPLASMSSARSTTSTGTTSSSRAYTSKIGVLPSSLPAYHKAYMEREKAGAGQSPPQASGPEDLSQPRTPAEQEETARRLKPHSRSQVRVDESTVRPQGMTPVNPTKKPKPTRWQFGIRSRNSPWEALSCIYKAMKKLGCKWRLDEDYEKVHGSGSALPSAQGSFADDYGGQSQGASATSIDPQNRYGGKLPANPWHIYARWETAPLRKAHAARTLQPSHGNKDFVQASQSPTEVIAMRFEIQLYEMEKGVYLVDFMLTGYETPDGNLLEEKAVTSPFPFLDMAAKLIMALADAD